MQNQGSYDPRPAQVGAALARAQQEYVDKTQAHPGYGQADATAEPRALDALTKMLREVRNRTNMAVTDLDSFLARATGERVLPPPAPAPAQVGAVQSPLHEAAELLGEITNALNSLENIQSRVDRIA